MLLLWAKLVLTLMWKDQAAKVELVLLHPLWAKLVRKDPATRVAKLVLLLAPWDPATKVPVTKLVLMPWRDLAKVAKLVLMLDPAAKVAKVLLWKDPVAKAATMVHRRGQLHHQGCGRTLRTSTGKTPKGSSCSTAGTARHTAEGGVPVAPYGRTSLDLCDTRTGPAHP